MTHSREQMNLAESYKERYGSKRAILPMVMMRWFVLHRGNMKFQAYELLINITVMLPDATYNNVQIRNKTLHITYYLRKHN
jgi:hypothetical protein